MCFRVYSLCWSLRADHSRTGPSQDITISSDIIQKCVAMHSYLGNVEFFAISKKIYKTIRIQV